MKINGKVAVVVGGARGIGLAYCEALLHKGAKVVIGDVLEEQGVKAVEEFNAKHGKHQALFVKCDNTKDDDIQNIFNVSVDKYGLPDIVIHNAAIIHEGDWQRCLDINVGGMVRTTNEALKYMSKANGGQGGVLVHTASISSFRLEDWGPVYCATKYAVLGYTLSWGLPANVEVTGVRFNCVCPTMVETELLNQVQEPARVYHVEKMPGYVSNTDTLKPSFVAEGMIKLVEDDTVSGRAMRVSQQYGHDYATIPDQPVQ